MLRGIAVRVPRGWDTTSHQGASPLVNDTKRILFLGDAGDSPFRGCMC